MDFPKHNCGLHLSHNQHKDYYQTLENYLEEQGFSKEDWVDGEEEVAMRTGEIWVLQWYPNTPVSFIRKCASNLDVLLEVSCKIDAVWK